MSPEMLTFESNVGNTFTTCIYAYGDRDFLHVSRRRDAEEKQIT